MIAAIKIAIPAPTAIILAMFMITQVLGVMICLKLINTNITVTIGIIGTLNFLLCKVLLFN